MAAVGDGGAGRGAAAKIRVLMNGKEDYKKWLACVRLEASRLRIRDCLDNCLLDPPVAPAVPRTTSAWRVSASTEGAHARRQQGERQGGGPLCGLRAAAWSVCLR